MYPSQAGLGGEHYAYTVRYVHMAPANGGGLTRT